MVQKKTYPHQNLRANMTHPAILFVQNVILPKEPKQNKVPHTVEKLVHKYPLKYDFSLVSVIGYKNYYPIRDSKTASNLRFTIQEKNGTIVKDILATDCRFE
jgi:hypothetical protein